jgi:hypothetical protein
MWLLKREKRVNIIDIIEVENIILPSIDIGSWETKIKPSLPIYKKKENYKYHDKLTLSIKL